MKLKDVWDGMVLTADEIWGGISELVYSPFFFAIIPALACLLVLLASWLLAKG